MKIGATNVFVKTTVEPFHHHRVVILRWFNRAWSWTLWRVAPRE